MKCFIFHIFSSNFKLNLVKNINDLFFFLLIQFSQLVDLRADFSKLKGPRPQVQEGRKFPEYFFCGGVFAAQDYVTHFEPCQS